MRCLAAAGAPAGQIRIGPDFELTDDASTHTSGLSNSDAIGEDRHTDPYGWRD